MALRGVRSVEIEASSVSRATRLLLSSLGTRPSLHRARINVPAGLGPYHHILAIHKASNGPALRRVTFDAGNAQEVDALA